MTMTFQMLRKISILRKIMNDDKLNMIETADMPMRLQVRAAGGTRKNNSGSR
jgi:hypothetical protein